MNKKIACLGNFNNNFFGLVRNLRDKGFDADLLLLNELEQFSPALDSFDDDFKKYTKQLNWEDIGWWKIKKEQIKKDLSEYDFFIGSGWAPAYLQKAGITLDIFAPHGGDLYRDPFYKFTKRIPPKSEIGNYFTSRAQRKGIEKTKFLFLDRFELYELAVKKLNFQGQRIFSHVPFLYAPQFFSIAADKYWNNESNYYSEFKKIREKYNLVIFHHTRHIWVDPPINGGFYKGNDKLIKGFANFIKQENDTNACLVLLEYGSDVQQSKELIKKLSIETYVKWFPRLGRKDIMGAIKLCDIGAGSISEGSSVSYGSAYEIIAMGKPLINHREDELHKNDYPELYPMYNANSAAEVAAIFKRFLTHKEEFVNVGLQSKEWFNKYAIEIPLDNLIKAIEP